MKRWKWKKTLIISGIIVLLFTCLGYWAMNIAVNKVLSAISSDSMIASMEVHTPVPTGIDPTATPITAAASPVPSNTPQSVHPSSPTPSDAVGSSMPTNHPTSTPASPTAGSIPQGTSSPVEYEGAIDSSKAEKAQEAITLKEKLMVTTIFMKRFTSKELDAFMKLSSGGLTLDEKVEAKKIVMEKLSPEEYDQLIGIAAKLGLSQGKNYQESKKEFEANGQ